MRRQKNDNKQNTKQYNIEIGCVDGQTNGHVACTTWRNVMHE